MSRSFRNRSPSGLGRYPEGVHSRRPRRSAASSGAATVCHARPVRSVNSRASNPPLSRSAFSMNSNARSLSGTARRARETFVASLRTTGEFLRGAATVERDRLAVEIERAARDIDALGGEPIVPIESLAAPEPATRPVAASTAAPAPAPQMPRGRMENAFAAYGQLRRERGAAEPSLEKLVHSATEPPVVAIESLCYRGRSALIRAAELRREILARLGPGRGLVEVRSLLDELLDLVPLALAEPD